MHNSTITTYLLDLGGTSLLRTDEAVITTGATGRITFLNPVAEQLTGWSCSDAQGHGTKEVFPLVHAETRRIIESPVERVIALGVGLSMTNHTILLARDGREIPIENSAVPSRDGQGNFMGVVLVFREVTVTKETPEVPSCPETRYRRLFEAARDGILLLDANTARITDSNGFMTELLGYSREELSGKELADIGLFKDREAAHQAMRQLQRDSYIRYEDLPLQTKSGQRRDVEFVSNIYDEEGVPVIQCNIRDITERKRVEEALVRHQAETVRLNERLRLTMAETHHRIKNNLQIIAAIVDLGLSKAGESVPTEELRRISASLRALAVMHDLLTEQARESGEANWVSAKVLLAKLLALLQQTAGPVEIRQTLAEGQLPIKQGTSLALILNELVSNAIKHGAVTVEVLYSVSKTGALLQVCDNGPEFPAGFDPARSGRTGLELVLNLSRWDLGGQVSFENRSEGGACVSVTIP